ncbi:aldehyde oxidase GLOX [Physcia stellaris]|nr:aldehyde oxidase GLOX [Physcia stellaris]
MKIIKPIMILLCWTSLAFATVTSLIISSTSTNGSVIDIVTVVITRRRDTCASSLFRDLFFDNRSSPAASIPFLTSTPSEILSLASTPSVILSSTTITSSLSSELSPTSLDYTSDAIDDTITSSSINTDYLPTTSSTLSSPSTVSSLESEGSQTPLSYSLDTTFNTIASSSTDTESSSTTSSPVSDSTDGSIPCGSSQRFSLLAKTLYLGSNNTYAFFSEYTNDLHIGGTSLDTAAIFYLDSACRLIVDSKIQKGNVASQGQNFKSNHVFFIPLETVEHIATCNITGGQLFCSCENHTDFVTTDGTTGPERGYVQLGRDGRSSSLGYYDLQLEVVLNPAVSTPTNISNPPQRF